MTLYNREPEVDPPVESAATLRWRLRYAWWGVTDHLCGWWRDAKGTTLDG